MLCPVCQGRHISVEMQVSSREASLHYLADPASERFARLQAEIERLWGQPHCDMALCGDCGFGFAWPYVAGSALFYDLAYQRTTYPADKWDFDIALAAVRRLKLAPRRVLEIGAGFGHFLDRLMPVLGTRPTIVATEYATPSLERLRAKGYDARACDVRELDEVEPFDLIVGFQVLEHLDNLDGLAAALRRLLAPGGVAMFAVPNPAQLKFNAQHGSLLDMPPNHIGRWTEPAFARFAEGCGLSLAAFEVEPQRLIEHLRYDLTYSFLRRAQRPGTLANRLRHNPGGAWNKLASTALALGHAPLRLNSLIAGAMRSDLGSSVFAVLTDARTASQDE